MWNPCFAPNLRGKTFHFFKLSKILDMGLLYMDFMMLSHYEEEGGKKGED